MAEKSRNASPVRRVRRAAERTALEALSGTFVSTAGELGVAHAERQVAATAVEAARARATAIMHSAKQDAAAVIGAAQAEAAEAINVYAEAWHVATDVGWSPAQLRAMGYPRPPTTRSVRRGRREEAAMNSASTGSLPSDGTSPSPDDRSEDETDQ